MQEETEEKTQDTPERKETESLDFVFNDVGILVPRRRKKKKKKKPFPTDPDDPDSEDFVEEDDDDDDDDDGTTGTDEGVEEENELKQEEKKQQTAFKDPFEQFKQPENKPVKPKPHDPVKPQKSPLQQFFDFLLHGVQGAKIKNGELKGRNSVLDELLLGLGFKAYLKDVLINKQFAKFWKQKLAGKTNAALLKTDLKDLKKQAGKDASIKTVLTDAKQRVETQKRKQMERPAAVGPIRTMQAPVKQKMAEPVRTLKVPERPAKVGEPTPERKPIQLTPEEAKKIIQAAEQEEKRIKAKETAQEMAKQAQGKQELMDAKSMDKQAQKNVEMAQRTSSIQNDKDQSFQQRSAVSEMAFAQGKSATINASEMLAAAKVVLAQANAQAREQHPPRPPMVPIRPEQNERLAPHQEERGAAVAGVVRMEGGKAMPENRNLPPAPQTMHDNAVNVTNKTRADEMVYTPVERDAGK